MGIVKIGLFLCYVLLGGISSCHSTMDKVKLDEVKWELETLNGKEVKLSGSDNVIFIEFDSSEKRVNGRAACNRFFGDYEVDGEKLNFSPMGATRMSCPDLSKETEFFKMLDAVDTYSIKDELLSCFFKEELIATFKMMKPEVVE